MHCNRTQPMTVEPQHLAQELEQAIQTLANPDLAHRLKPILLANLDRGRVHRFLDKDSATVYDYVWLVSQRFLTLQTYLHQLQITRDASVWAPLYQRMQTWAYNFFLRKNFAADDHTREIAIECANNAALNLIKAHFPYDTEFDAWAHVLVQHACHKFIGHSLKKSVVPEEKQVELTDDLTVPNDLLIETQLVQHEFSARLQAALAQLTEARRRVIQMSYLEELEPEEIAQILGKSVGAVYSLQFHGLRDLRKILNPNRDNLNE